MRGSRRSFLKKLGGLAGVTACGAASATRADTRPSGSEPTGVLVDTTLCVGCRRCEKACNAINTDLPRRDAAFYEDQTVFQQPRRMDAAAYTVVNRYRDDRNPSKPVFAKFQCMHCREPACASACIVGALTRDPSTGAVLYDAGKCIGCRYCLAACPFQVPAYEYDNVLTPQVRKCHYCHQARLSQGLIPACVQACPMEVMTLGPRSALLEMARDRQRAQPDRYVPQVYGENEVGGTSWLYLSSIPFQALGLPKLGYHSIPGYTEPIQHAIFKWFLPPLSVYAALGALWWHLSRRKENPVLVQQPTICASSRAGTTLPASDPRAGRVTPGLPAEPCPKLEPGQKAAAGHA